MLSQYCYHIFIHIYNWGWCLMAWLGALLIDDWLTYNMDGLKDTIGGATL